MSRRHRAGSRNGLRASSARRPGGSHSAFQHRGIAAAARPEDKGTDRIADQMLGRTGRRSW